MRKLFLIFAIYFSILPAIAFAGRHSFHSQTGMGASAAFKPRHVHGRIGSPTHTYWSNGIARPLLPNRSPSGPGHRQQQAKPGIKPPHHGKPKPPMHVRPRYVWPATTTVVKEVPTIVIVNPPPPAEPPPPEPQKTWVPPVMGVRTEPGYWDYGVKKKWMGDHWRYEQDVTRKTWVPEAQVEYVKQAGYWKVAE